MYLSMNKLNWIMKHVKGEHISTWTNIYFLQNKIPQGITKE